MTSRDKEHLRSALRDITALELIEYAAELVAEHRDASEAQTRRQLQEVADSLAEQAETGLLSNTDAVRYTRTSRSTLARARKSGTLRFRQNGRRIRYERDWLDDWTSGKSEGPTPDSR